MSLQDMNALFYTPEEARKKLGMTRDAFNHYVRQGWISKTVFIGKHGKFLRSEIDYLANQFEAIMLRAQKPQLAFQKANALSFPREMELAELVFGESTKEFHPARQQLLNKNKDMSYYLFDHNRLVASINVTPLDPEGIERFKQGVRGWLLQDHVVPIVPGTPVQLIIIDLLSTPLVPVNKRTYYAYVLLQHLSKVFAQWGKLGIQIQSFYANGGTFEGKRLLETAHFSHIGTFGNRVIYELKEQDFRIKFLRPYQEAYQKYLEKKTKTSSPKPSTCFTAFE